MGRIVLAYHGCDITTRDRLVRGEIEPRISSNQYDWLGDGMYFFEGDPSRALKLAQNSHDNPNQLLTRKAIATPAAVGAILEVERWFDLTTQVGIENFTHAAQAVIDGSANGGTPPPVNKPAFEGDEDLLHRAFDKAACDMVHTLRKYVHEQALHNKDTAAIIASAPYQAARGAFEQGGFIADGSSICVDTHIQIAVRDLSCIKGWFLLPGDKLLREPELADATKRLEQAEAQRTAKKPRRTAR